jgi:hypothetical protein
LEGGRGERLGREGKGGKYRNSKIKWCRDYLELRELSCKLLTLQRQELRVLYSQHNKQCDFSEIHNKKENAIDRHAGQGYVGDAITFREESRGGKSRNGGELTLKRSRKTNGTGSGPLQIARVVPSSNEPAGSQPEV